MNKKHFWWMSVAMGTTLLMSSAGAVYQDTNGHWAAQSIDRFSEYGILQGFDGNFRPNAPIMRGEMAVILDRLMGYQTKSTNQFADLRTDFYTDSVLKVHAAGVMQGSNGLVRPTDTITRAEAVTMIARALDITGNGTVSFQDQQIIPEWARDAVSAMRKSGYITGDKNGNFSPNRTITRAEVVTILANIFGNVYGTAGSYQVNTRQDVIVSTTDVTLKDSVIEGDLYLAPGIADGDVTLDNVTVKGRTLIWGGGENSIHVRGGSLDTVTIARDGGIVRLDVQNDAKIANVSVASDAVLDGTVSKATLVGGDLTVRGNVAQLTIDEKAGQPSITVDKEARLQKLEVFASSDIRVSGKVDFISVESSAEGTSIEGSGTVKEVQANANDTTVKTEKTTVSVGKDVTGVTNQGSTVKPGSTSDSSSSSSSSSGSSGSSGSPGTPGGTGGTGGSGGSNSNAISIVNVEAVRNGHVRVTLNQATDRPLDQSAFSIICTGAGKDMTILRISTQDNRVYDLNTAFYDDSTYNLEVTLPDGTRINKDFETKFDCADIQIQAVNRTGETSAQVEYTTDANGEFFYILRPQVNTLRRARSVSDAPTADQIIKEGTRVVMDDQHQIITLNELQANTAYEMYYVARDNQYGYERVTPVKSLKIPATPQSDTGSISISNLDYDFRIDGFENTAYWFTAKLSEPTETTLSLDAFRLSCPQGDFTLEKVESTDNQTYTVYLKQGTLPYSNINVTMTITLPDGTSTRGSVYFDTAAPIVDWDGFTWKTPDTAEIRLRSSESGTLYYKVYDHVEQDTSLKDPKDIFETGKQVSISSGSNLLEVSGLTGTSEKYFCFATKDKKGNPSLYYTYKQIPAYKEPELPDQSAPKITKVEASSYDGFLGGFTLTITFDQQVTWTYQDKSSIEVTNIERTPTISTDGGGTSNKFTVNFEDARLNAGAHTLTMVLHDGKTVRYDFTTDQPIGKN